MGVPCVSKRTLLSGLLAGSLTTAHAQSAPADSVRRPAPLLLKAGLRLTHLRYSHDNQTWQFLLPLSVGVEYRLAPAFSLYTQVEADVLVSHTARRRRNAQSGSVPTSNASLGLRYYYGRFQATNAHYPTPEFGKYLALDGNAEWQQLAGTGRRSRTFATLLPSVFVLWGIQNRLHPHLLYDLNAGLGVLAPAHYYNFEHLGNSPHWDMSAQVNIRLYFGT